MAEHCRTVAQGTGTDTPAPRTGSGRSSSRGTWRPEKIYFPHPVDFLKIRNCCWIWSKVKKGQILELVHATHFRPGDGIDIFSNLEVGILKDICCGVKVLDLLEGTHDFLPDHTALLVYQLDGGPLAIVGDTVPHLDIIIISNHTWTLPQSHSPSCQTCSHHPSHREPWSWSVLSWQCRSPHWHRGLFQPAENIWIPIKWHCTLGIELNVTWICIQHLRLSPRKLAVTGSSMSTWYGLKVTAFS